MSAADPVSAPVFILGAPRSGTSLLRNLLNRHPTFGLCDENYFFYYLYNRRRAFGDLQDPANRRFAVTQFLNTHRVRQLNLDLSGLADALLREGSDYPALFLALMRFYACSRGKARGGEKTPDHALYLETLLRWYPQARFLFLVRDPRDVVASLLRMPWASGDVLANARVWQSSVSVYLSHQNRENLLLVHYERLAEDVEGTLRAICAFLQEPYAPEMVTPDPTAVAEAWWFQRALGAVSGDRVEHWRQQLSPQQVALVEWITRPALQALGYAPAARPLSWHERARALGASSLASTRSKFENLPRLYYYWLKPTQLQNEEAWIDHHR